MELISSFIHSGCKQDELALHHGVGWLLAGQPDLHKLLLLLVSFYITNPPRIPRFLPEVLPDLRNVQDHQAVLPLYIELPGIEQVNLPV